MSEYLFTYGTLRPGCAPGEISQAVGKLRLVGRGFVGGTVYDLGEYPGAVVDPSSTRRISGSVYRLPEDAGVLLELDGYEGFTADAPEESLFIRMLHTMTFEEGGTLQCWVYTYNRNPGLARILADGEDW